MSRPDNYIDAPINSEIAILPKTISLTGKDDLNRAAFQLGRIRGTTTDTAINALLLAPRSNGYVKEHSERAARQVNQSWLKHEQRTSRAIGEVDRLSPLRLPDAQATEPLPAEQSARPAAMLTANPTSDQPIASAAPEPLEAVAAADADVPVPERNDERLYGPHAAQILRNSKRDVALAPADAKTTAFQEVTKRIGQAVADQWLPKAVMVDRLLEIAVAHGSFGLTPEQIQQIIADAAEAICSPKNAPVSPPLTRRLITRRASDVQPEKLIWVWPGRIPEGKLVLVGGPPGLGKSQLTAFIAATVSNGGAWPCGEGSTAPGNVIIMSAEDGIEDTIIPRLIAAGANMDRVYIVASATKSDGTGRKTFNLKTDVDLLEAKAKEIGGVRLISVDPVSAYMGGSDGNGNVETREVLEPLAEMANRLRIAVVAVTHLNKGGGGGQQSALNRFAGSIAFVAAARAAFAVVEDAEDDNRRLFLQVKNNLGPKCKGLAFRMEQRLIPGDILSSNIFFESEHVTQSIDEALTASESRGGGGQTSSKEDAAEFLAEILAYGPVDVLEVERQARAATLLDDDKRLRQNKAFREARKDLGVLSTRDGFGPGARYVLSLPGIPCAPENTMCAPHPGGGAHGQSGRA
jgi:putative DNA primase/helicase